MTTASELLAVAKSQLGITSGEKYWKFVFPNFKYVDGNRTPYCACFCSWVADKAKQKVDGLPAGYCPWILNQWKKTSRMHPAKDAKPGDFITFDWQGDGVSDHIGIVESNDGTALHTIEGNTNGGKVMRRVRAYKTVSGCYRPAYEQPKEDDVLDEKDLKEVSFNVWHYKNKKLEKGDAYQILRDIRDGVDALNKRVAALEKKVK